MPEIDIEALQREIVDKLESESFFSTVPVVSRRKWQIVSEMDRALISVTPKGGKVGVGCMVMMPTINIAAPNAPGPEYDLLVAIRIEEDPVLNMDSSNGTLKNAEDVAVEVSQQLHQWQINNLCALYPERAHITPNDEIDGKVAYDVIFRARLPITVKNRVTLPDISDSGLIVTLTNNTSGATIYYTTDGTFPGSGNSAATVYTVPFLVADGATVRWAAYKSGMTGSDIGQAIIVN